MKEWSTLKINKPERQRNMQHNLDRHDLWLVVFNINYFISKKRKKKVLSKQENLSCFLTRVKLQLADCFVSLHIRHLCQSIYFGKLVNCTGSSSLCRWLQLIQWGNCCLPPYAVFTMSMFPISWKNVHSNENNCTGLRNSWQCFNNELDCNVILYRESR